MTAQEIVNHCDMVETGNCVLVVTGRGMYLVHASCLSDLAYLLDRDDGFVRRVRAQRRGAVTPTVQVVFGDPALTTFGRIQNDALIDSLRLGTIVSAGGMGNLQRELEAL